MPVWCQVTRCAGQRFAILEGQDLEGRARNTFEARQCFSLCSLCNDPKVIAEPDIVLTTYGVLTAAYKTDGECSIFHEVDWYMVVLDETHTIKSSRTQCAQAAFKLSSHCRWCLTGTPLQDMSPKLYSASRVLFLLKMQGKGSWRTANAALQPISKMTPKTKEELRDVKGIGKLVQIALGNTKTNYVGIDGRNLKVSDSCGGFVVNWGDYVASGFARKITQVG
ncbi:hypothetical protein RJ640_018095 [Escallonia rubra]|uniref:SNF2 N-terminal domain-containing protein n=1 Tax=Escallonia rubra TaxID=112253 RepID=A0AA88U024_9ASTE|nr:hypothetical protein RJ640_018095 [Escallonia rubra]